MVVYSIVLKSTVADAYFQHYVWVDFPIYRVFRLPIFRFGIRHFTEVSVRYFRYKNMIYMEQYSNAKRIPKITVFICLYLISHDFHQHYYTPFVTIQLFWILFWVFLFAIRPIHLQPKMTSKRHFYVYTVFSKMSYWCHVDELGYSNITKSTHCIGYVSDSLTTIEYAFF